MSTDRVSPRAQLRLIWPPLTNRTAVSVAFLYHFVRRPTHILDHGATLAFNHIVLTTYFSRAFPTSLFFWLVLGGTTIGTILWAERLCVTREMHESMGDWSGNVAEEGQAGEEVIPLTNRSSGGD